MKILQHEGCPISRIGASAGPLSMMPCNKSRPWLIQDLCLGIVMSRIRETCSQIGASSIIISIMVIVLITIIMIMNMKMIMIMNMIMIMTMDIISSSAVIRYLPKTCSSQGPGFRPHDYGQDYEYDYDYEYQ